MILLTLALNSLNRSMGFRDLYPFVLPELAMKKSRFVHDVIQKAAPRQPFVRGWQLFPCRALTHSRSPLMASARRKLSGLRLAQ